VIGMKVISRELKLLNFNTKLIVILIVLNLPILYII